MSKNILTPSEAAAKFEDVINSQFKRIEKMKSSADFVDYSAVDTIVIGICGGDGIGPAITAESERVLKAILSDKVSKGKIVFKEIDGLTLENRLSCMKPIPDDVLAELKSCHVILKGPTTTPDASAGTPNIESANVAMRRELDLFANVRPVSIPSEGIDWTFFRENTEGAYAVGSLGVNLEGLAIDFTVTTDEGTERIARLAYEFAKANNKKRVSIVTKANVIKKTDGKFLEICKRISEEYPEIKTDDWYIDIMTAKLLDENRRRDFEVMVLPNLYGDIITDEAAELQGGVGTAGSANIGKRYAMFEAIHGSAPRMVKEGRAKYADPSSMLRASAMLLRHIGYANEGNRLDKALDICMFEEKKLTVTGREDGATGREFSDYVISVLERI
ncbi:MAG: isocitrate/isopropylmalate dehydrogenase family protein [Ruminococcaceae bacterium]|nr:isocitrate/isopropylmalate dehydrogenase family protein [Oscillospiraceae bacterium]